MGLLDLFFGKRGKRGWSSSRTYISSQTAENIESDWNQIKILMKGKSPSQLKQALIMADKAVDNALRDLVSGETMGERLKNSKDRFEYNLYDSLWKAHKVRNKLVHESGFNPPYYVIEQHMKTFKKVLSKLGVKV